MDSYTSSQMRRSSSNASSLDARPAHLDLSALSPSEYSVYPKWLLGIKASRSGEPEHIDEQDALRFLREEFGIEVKDEIKVSNLHAFFNALINSPPFRYFHSLRDSLWVCYQVIFLLFFVWLRGSRRAKYPPKHSCFRRLPLLS